MTPIGTIHTPYRQLAGMPIQPAGAAGIKGQVEVFDDYAAGLRDIDGFSHIILLYLFDRSEGYNLEVTPFLDTVPRGLFATRAPKRPNPIGLSIVQLDAVEGNRLHVSNIDVLDGTPLLDIKPYAPVFDRPDNVRAGWLEGSGDQVETKRSDKRFTD